MTPNVLYCIFACISFRCFLVDIKLLIYHKFTLLCYVLYNMIQSTKYDSSTLSNNIHLTESYFDLVKF